MYTLDNIDVPTYNKENYVPKKKDTQNEPLRRPC